MAQRGPAIRVATAIAAFLVACSPSVARANDLSGIAVILAGVVIGVPAALLLLLATIVSIAANTRPKAPWHRTWAVVTFVFAPVLAAVYPLSLALWDGNEKLVGAAILFDAPVILLALVTLGLSFRLHRRAQ